ncbi:hypothetical protein [Clostridium thermarum]|uniref:hypothetical protein n=1 Tax=Clostridium thermarum TaxID=1716543 RepID=UPI0013D46D0D|nr:hypothetical protein [Clostridium thermarum]
MIWTSKVSEKVIEKRELAAALFYIDNPFNVIFTSSATVGLNIGIKGLLKPRGIIRGEMGEKI